MKKLLVDSRTKRLIMPFQFRTVLKSCLIILPYFSFSIGITFYQREFLQIFHFPLIVVSCHLVWKFLLSTVIRYLYYKTNVPVVPWNAKVSKFLPIGVSSGIDVGFSNWGLELVNVSLYTMTKSTAIIFVLVNALILRLEKPSLVLFFVVFSISGGLFLFTFKTTDFSTLGFILLLAASFSSGFRWTVSQFVMQKGDMDFKNPIDMMYFSQPWMFMTVFPISIFLEGNDFLTWWNNHQIVECFQMICGIIVGSCLAFGLETSEYFAVYKTSSITLTVVGIIKEICTLILAWIWNGDKMTSVQFAGLVLCMLGVGGHVWQKFKHSRSTDSRYGIVGDDVYRHLTLPESDSDDSTDSKSSTEVLFDILNRRNS